MTFKRCKLCGGMRFHVAVKVSQTWLVESDGKLVNAITTCDEILERLGDNAVWACANCGVKQIGRNFNIDLTPHHVVHLTAKTNTCAKQINIEVFNETTNVDTAIQDSIREYLATPEGREYRDNHSTFTYDDLSKIPELIFIKHNIRVVTDKNTTKVVNMRKNLMEGLYHD